MVTAIEEFCFLDLASTNLQSLEYKPLSRRPLAALCRLPPLDQMTELTHIRLHAITFTSELSSLRCLSLLQLDLVGCMPEEVLQGLQTAFPNLQRLHIEHHSLSSLSAEQPWDELSGAEIVRDAAKMTESSSILHSLHRLSQLSGNSIVRALA